MTPSTISPELLLQQLNWRYATKQFDATKTIPADQWQALVQSMVLAPSSFGLQPWKFFVVRNPDLRQQMVQAAWGQSQVVDASHLVVFARKNDMGPADVEPYIQRMAEVRQTSVESLEGLAGMVKGFFKEPPYPLDPNAWANRQVYIALGMFLHSAALLGIDTCPMEGFVPAQIDDLLNLPAQGYSAVVLCAAGYRSEQDKYASLAKVRYPLEDVVGYLD
jgi:nitroreductase